MPGSTIQPLIFSFTITSNASIYYSEIFTTNEGGSISIEILPDVTEFQTGRAYSFSVGLKPEIFLSNQIKYDEIYIQLRLFVGNITIFSELNSPYQFDSINDYISTNILLNIPTYSQLQINEGQSIFGSLQLKVDFKVEILLLETVLLRLNSILDLALFGLIHLLHGPET